MDNLDQAHVVWEHASKREVCRLEVDEYFEYDAVFSPNGDYLAAVVESVPAFRVWNCDTGTLVSSLDADCGRSIAFSPATPIVAVEEGEVVYLLDRESCNCVHTIDARSSIEKIAFSPAGRHLAVAKRSGLISLYDSETWTPIRSLEAVPMEDMMVAAIIDLAFNPNSAQLAVASSDGIVRLMNIETGNCDSQTRLWHGGPERDKEIGLVRQFVLLAFTPDGRQLIAVAEPERIMRLQLESGQIPGTA